MQAPPKYENGKSNLWSEPTSNLMQWGIINPTNPIVPLTDTLAATNIAQKIISRFFNFTVSIPKLAATSSPVRITHLNPYWKQNNITTDIKDTININNTAPIGRRKTA